MTEESAAENKKEDTRKEAEKIASEGTDVRDKIRKLVVDTLKTSKSGIEDLSAAISEVLDGVATAVDQSVPEDRSSVLRQTFDGLSDAFTTTANAMRLAFEEAKERGETFAKEDLGKAINDLGKAEELFLGSVEELAKRSSAEIGSQLKEFVQHARQTGTTIKPSVEAALDAARSHPKELFNETASAGANLSRKAAGQFLYSVSGLLEIAGDLISGTEKNEELEQEQGQD